MTEQVNVRQNMYYLDDHKTRLNNTRQGKARQDNQKTTNRQDKTRQDNEKTITRQNKRKVSLGRTYLRVNSQI